MKIVAQSVTLNWAKVWPKPPKHGKTDDICIKSKLLSKVLFQLSRWTLPKAAWSTAMFWSSRSRTVCSRQTGLPLWLTHRHPPTCPVLLICFSLHSYKSYSWSKVQSNPPWSFPFQVQYLLFASCKHVLNFIVIKGLMQLIYHPQLPILVQEYSRGLQFVYLLELNILALLRKL